MTYEFHPAENYLFHCGERGTKFYVILHGQASVRIPVAYVEN
jgi:hypothetical protein